MTKKDTQKTTSRIETPRPPKVDEEQSPDLSDTLSSLRSTLNGCCQKMETRFQTVQHNLLRKKLS